MLLDHKADERSSDNIFIMLSNSSDQGPTYANTKNFKKLRPNVFFFSTTLCPPSRRQRERGRVFHFINVGENLCRASLSLATLALFQGHDGFLDSSESYNVSMPCVLYSWMLRVFVTHSDEIAIQNIGPSCSQRDAGGMLWTMLGSKTRPYAYWTGFGRRLKVTIVRFSGMRFVLWTRPHSQLRATCKFRFVILSRSVVILGDM